MSLRAQDDWSDVFDFLLLPILDQQYLVRMVKVKKRAFMLDHLGDTQVAGLLGTFYGASCCVHGHTINQQTSALPKRSFCSLRF